MFQCRVLVNRNVKIKTGLFLVLLLSSEWCKMREVILGLAYLFVWFICCVWLGWVYFDEGTMLVRVLSAGRHTGPALHRSHLVFLQLPQNAPSLSWRRFSRPEPFSGCCSGKGQALHGRSEACDSRRRPFSLADWISEMVTVYVVLKGNTLASKK